MTKQKTFLDEDIPIDTAFFADFPAKDIVSWAHLELWCATRSIEMNKDVVWFITTGAVYIDTLYDIILEAIETTDFINEYVNRVEYVELVYKLFQPTRSNKKYEYTAKQAWIKYLNDHDDKYVWFRPAMAGNDDYARMYKLMSAIDKRFPLLLIHFYNKFKQTLHLYDLSFTEWIMKRSSIKAQHSKLFKKIYAAMEKEFKANQRIASFLV